MGQIRTPSEDELIEHANKWLDIVNSFGHTDRARAEAALKSIYAENSIPAAPVIWAGSPIEAYRKLAEYAINSGDKDVKGKTLEQAISHAVNNIPIFSVQASATPLAHYEMCKIVGYVEETKKLEPFWELAYSLAKFAIFTDEVIIAVEAPVLLAYEPLGPIRGKNRLIPEGYQKHNESGPSLEYADGYKEWYIHGVAVNEQIVMRPDTLTLKQIEAEKDTEVRRIMIERWGFEKYIHETDPEILDMDSGGNEGTPRCLVKTRNGEKFLYGTDGSTKRVYTMPVPDEARSCAHAHSLIAGFDESKIKSQS